jgi:hypothetical protein
VGVAWATLLPTPWQPVSNSAAAKEKLITAPILIRLVQVFIFVVPVRMVVLVVMYRSKLLLEQKPRIFFLNPAGLRQLGGLH